MLVIFGAMASVLTGAVAEEFPLIGLWKAVAAEKDGKGQISEGAAMEFEFLPDGVMIITCTDPERNVLHPIRMRWAYKYIAPDILTYTLKGDPIERQRFQIKDDKLYLEHLDYPTKAILRRIQNTEFTEVPIETQEFPK